MCARSGKLKEIVERAEVDEREQERGGKNGVKFTNVTKVAILLIHDMRFVTMLCP